MARAETLDREELNALREKYSSGPHFMLLKADDSGFVYFLKGGKNDVDLISSLQADVLRLIKILELSLE
jgi:hypothetical protein